MTVGRLFRSRNNANGTEAGRNRARACPTSRSRAIKRAAAAVIHAQLAADKISVQSRIVTIADIYDALSAGVRPYKRGLPEDKVLDVLTAEVRAARIDGALYQVFLESGCGGLSAGFLKPRGSWRLCRIPV